MATRYFFTRSRDAGRATHVHVFDSVADMVAQSNTPAHAAQDPGIVRRIMSRASGDDWTYGALKDGATYDHAMLTGWRDALPRIEALAARVAPNVATPLDVRRKLRRGPEGDELDIHAVNAGNLPRAWSARRRSLARAPAPIRILCNVIYNCASDGEDFFWRGAVALALVRALRRKGYRTAISGIGLLVSPYSARGRKSALDYVARFDALRYGEAIDTARLAAVLCSPAMLRHTIFRTVLTTPAQVSSGFGYAPRDEQTTACIVASGAWPQTVEERLVIPDLRNQTAAGEWLARMSARFA